jgi:hypothetical protein
MCWKIRWDQPGIFSMGVWKNFLVLLWTHFNVFFHSHIIDPRKILQFFVLTCSHYKQMSLSIPHSSFLFILSNFTTTPVFVFTKPSSLFSSSNKIVLHTYACSFTFFWLDKCMFLQALWLK